MWGQKPAEILLYENDNSPVWGCLSRQSVCCRTSQPSLFFGLSVLQTVKLVTICCKWNRPRCFPSSGVLPPHLCKPPPPCGATRPGGATAQRKASTRVTRHRFPAAHQGGRATADRRQPEPKHQQRHLPLPCAEASERGDAPSGSPSYLHQPPDLQGPSDLIGAAVQARPQRQ